MQVISQAQGGIFEVIDISDCTSAGVSCLTMPEPLIVAVPALLGPSKPKNFPFEASHKLSRWITPAARRTYF
jgi:hypothetical protein